MPYYEKHDEAYYYDGQLYCSSFPLEWVERSIEGTGPLDCVLCDTHGSINGIFLGYCVYCADEYHEWGEHRGNGLTEEGSVEMNLENYDYYLPNNGHTSFIMENLHTYRGKGALDTYLRDIDRSRFMEKEVK